MSHPTQPPSPWQPVRSSSHHISLLSQLPGGQGQSKRPWSWASWFCERTWKGQRLIIGLTPKGECKDHAIFPVLRHGIQVVRVAVANVKAGLISVLRHPDVGLVWRLEVGHCERRLGVNSAPAKKSVGIAKKIDLSWNAPLFSHSAIPFHPYVCPRQPYRRTGWMVDQWQMLLVYGALAY